MGKYISVSQFAKKYGKDPGNIRKLLISGIIKGQKVGNQWVIDDKEEYPIDRRISEGKYRRARQKANLYKNKELKSNMKLMIDDLKELLADYMDSIVIYGSYARGIQNEESDIDIAIFLEKTDSDIRKTIIDCSSKYELELGKTLSIVDIDINKYGDWKDSLPFYQNILKEGIVLWKKS